MSMTGGSASVADDDPETETLSGLAGAIYTSLKASNAASYNAAMAAFDEAIAMARPHMVPADLEAARVKMRADKKQASVALKRLWAKQANELGPPIVAYIQANAVVSLANVKATVDTSTSVGKLPATLTPGDPIDAPSENVELPVTGQDGATALGVQ